MERDVQPFRVPAGSFVVGELGKRAPAIAANSGEHDAEVGRGPRASRGTRTDHSDGEALLDRVGGEGHLMHKVVQR